MSKDPQSLPPEKLPQVTAFQDEFTRKFMDSTEPVKEGYYLFRSGVNGYTMLFPEGAKLSEKGYSAPDKFYEAIDYGGGKGNTSYFVSIKYIRGGSVNTLDVELNGFRAMINYEGEFTKKEMADKYVFYGEKKNKYEHVKDTVYNFFSFIKSTDSNQGMRFYYSVTCQDVQKPCHLDVKKEEERAKALMESVKFID